MNRSDRRLSDALAIALSNLLNNDAGHALVEYALVLVLIVGAVLLVEQSLSARVSRSLADASGALSGTAAELGGTSSRQPVAVAAAVGEPAFTAGPAFSLLLPLVIAIAAVALCVTHRIRARKADKEADEADDASSAGPVQAAYISKRHDILRAISADMGSLLHNRLIARQVMSPRVAQVTPDTPVAGVAELMREQKMRHLLVCMADGRLQGVISDRDLPVRRGETAGKVMTPNPATVAPDAALSAIVSLMLDRRISSVPVVERDRVVGIVTMTDVAMTLQCALQSMEKLVREIEKYGPSPTPALRCDEDLEPSELASTVA